MMCGHFGLSLWREVSPGSGSSHEKQQGQSAACICHNLHPSGQ